MSTKTDLEQLLQELQDFKTALNNLEQSLESALTESDKSST